MKGEFTGKHMAVIIVSGFAIIIAVNDVDHAKVALECATE